MSSNSGIYMFTSPSGGKYIGLTFDIDKRKSQHIDGSKNLNNKSLLIVKKLHEYGFENFKFEVLEFIPKLENESKKDHLKRLSEREIYWIDYYKTFYLDGFGGYNRTRGGEGSLGEFTQERLDNMSKGLLNAWKDPIKYNNLLIGIANRDYTNISSPRTEDQKRKMSERCLGEGNSFYGKKHTEESKEKISESLKGDKNPFYGKKHTEETKEKIRQARLKRKIDT
jgi:hypothetical protein